MGRKAAIKTLMITTLSLSATWAPDAFAVVRTSKIRHQLPIASNEDFPTDPFVRRQIRFWESIFQKYKSNSIVIHDLDDPLAMLDVIDFDRYVTALAPGLAVGVDERVSLSSLEARFGSPRPR